VPCLSSILSAEVPSERCRLCQGRARKHREIQSMDLEKQRCHTARYIQIWQRNTEKQKPVDHCKSWAPWPKRLYDNQVPPIAIAIVANHAFTSFATATNKNCKGSIRLLYIGIIIPQNLLVLDTLLAWNSVYSPAIGWQCSFVLAGTCFTCALSAHCLL